MDKYLDTLKNEAWLRQKYEQEGLTVQRIAGLVGVSIAWVSHWLAQFGIETRSGPERIIKDRNCAYCNRVFRPRNSKRMCCSKSCARLAENPKAKETIRCREWLHQKYIIEKLSCSEIAALAGCATELPVQMEMKKFGIKARDLREAKKLYFDKRGRRTASKREMIEAYGGKCVCCGEAEEAFLTLDHIGGGGAAHRRRMRAKGKDAAREIRAELKAQGWPKDKYRLLCIGCNFATARGRTCPHQLLREQGITRVVLHLTAEDVQALEHGDPAILDKIRAALPTRQE